MLTLAQRVFGLSGRELARAIPLFAYLFFVIAGTVASKAARDALFLDRFRAVDLPYVDIAIALIVGLVASIYIRAGERTNLRNLQVTSLLAFAGSALAFWWGTRGTISPQQSDILFVVIYIWVGVISVVVPTQVWTLANYVLTTREAKRSFGFIGAGAILGWIVGGAATTMLVERFGTEATLLWVALALTLSAGLVLQVWRNRPSYVEDDSPAIAPDGRSATDSRLLASLADVSRSPYLTAIAFVIALAAFVTTIAGWQFKAIAKANIPDTDQLAEFFGMFNMIAGVAALVTQLLLTGRLLRRVGVGIALFIVPAALALSSAGLLIAGRLIAAVALKASDQVLRYSVDKATVELLYLPVPHALTFRVKSFIDTVVYRLGDALGGVTVLLFAGALGLSAVQMTWVTLALVLCWIWAAAVARRAYVENLRESIHQHRVDTERANAPVIDKSASEILAGELSGTPERILYALSLFEAARDVRVHPAIRGLLKHESGEVRQHALRLLSRAGDVSVVHDVERLLYDPHLEVRTEALLYLAEHAHVDPLERIEQLGDFPDFSLRAAMAAFLARPGVAQNLDAARAIIGAMVSDRDIDGRRVRIEAARLLGMLPDVFERDLRALLQDDAPEVAVTAMRSVARLRKRTLVPRIIDRLAEPSLTEEAVATLASFGDATVGTLRDALADPAVPVEIRRELPAALLTIGTRTAQYALMENVIDADTIVRHRIIAALNKLLQHHPERRLDRNLVETLLRAEIMGHYRSYQVLNAPGARLGPGAQSVAETMRQEAERIFRLLKMLNPQHDMHSAYVGLQSDDPIVHDNAVEFLEAVLSPELRTLVIPLFDRDVTSRDRAHIAAQLYRVEVESGRIASAAGESGQTGTGAVTYPA
jgi:ATP:ADP antiporter, AAA family